MTPLKSACAIAQTNAADPIDAAKVVGLMIGYDARWSGAQYRIDEVEVLVTSDLFNPQTQRKSRSFTMAGVIDVIAAPLHDRSRRVIFDHKTTTDDISDPNAPFWRQLRIDGQASIYMLLEWLNGRKVDEAVWDVTRKPSIRPRTLTKAEKTAISMTREWFSYRLTEEQAEAAVALGSETPDLYACRLAQDCTVERPEWYFQRRAVPRLDVELLEYAQDLWEHGQDLLHERAKGAPPSRNPGACMLYGRPCQYLGICSGYDTPDSDRWRVKEQVHSELTIDGDGRDVLTNSRIRTFQTCRRKEFYQYRLGIERIEDEEAEALRFGTLWHQALEAYFNTLKEQHHGNRNASDVAGIEPGHAEALCTR